MKLDELIAKLTEERALHGNLTVTFITDDYHKDIEGVSHVIPNNSMEEERIELS